MIIIHYYLFCLFQVLLVTWKVFVDNLKTKANTIDELIHVHESFLTSVSQR